jgi:coenzyme F420-reducing hydrogenase delta subunit
VERAKEFLQESGLEPERLEMFNLSSAEGTRFAEIVSIMHERLTKLGPNPLKNKNQKELHIAGVTSVSTGTERSV